VTKALNDDVFIMLIMDIINDPLHPIDKVVSNAPSKCGLCRLYMNVHWNEETQLGV